MKTDNSNTLLADAPASAQATSQPTYGNTHFDSGAHYAVTDPTPPVDDGGIVKLGTGNMSDTVFLNQVQAENDSITSNPNFTTPSPTVAAMSAGISDFNQKLNAVVQARNALKEATNLKDVSRANLEALYKARAAYVQITSNGNSALILNAGFPLRSTPSPIGELPPPMNFRVELNGTIGKMILNWNSVLKAKGYLVECAVAGGPTLDWKLIEVGGKPTLTLWNQEVGVTYVFRVAAVGGAGGRSPWSTEVTRTAA